jgi:hypothetical protein
MIARLARVQGVPVSAAEDRFVELCLDVLGSRLKPGPGGEPDPRMRQMLVRLIEHYCAPGPIAGPAVGRVGHAA